MESTLNHPLIIVTEADVKKARQVYGINDPNIIKESLDALEEWCRKQEHLADANKHLTRKVLERLFVIAKGSIEETKTRLDRLLTSRGMMPEILSNRNIEEFDDLLNCIIYVPLPKLYPVEQSRVMITQFKNDKYEDFTILGYFRFAFMVGEYRLNFDYSLAERYIIDLANISINLIAKFNPIVLKKAEILCTDAFGTKIKGIHILNAPTFVDKLLFLLKQALREKVASRIHVHSSYEDLHKHIPKEILPKDYGGDDLTCSKLQVQWRDVLKTEEARKIIADMDLLVSDETKRHSSKFNEEYMGMPGSFRKLNVD